MWRVLLLLVIGCGGGVRQRPAAAECAGWVEGVGGGRGLGVQAARIRDEMGGREMVRVGVRGNRAVPAEMVLAVAQVKAGQVVDREAIGEDLRRVWALEAFDDVAAELVSEGRGVALQWVVMERALVG